MEAKSFGDGDGDGDGCGAAAPHVALLATPGAGHLIAFAELAKTLVARHGFSVTIITFAASASEAQNAVLSSLPPAIASLALPAVPLDDLPSDAGIVTIMSVAASRSNSFLRTELFRLKASSNLVALVADLFATDAFAVAHGLGIPQYMFFATNLLTLSILLHLPELDASVDCEYRDLPEPLRLPGCIPVPGPELLRPVQDRSNEDYRWILHHGRQFWDAEGIIVNTFEAFTTRKTTFRNRFRNRFSVSKSIRNRFRNRIFQFLNFQFLKVRDRFDKSVSDLETDWQIGL